VSLSNCRKWNINIDWLEADNFDFFPNIQELCYYPSVGKLVFSSHEKVYAVLYKDNYLSDKTNE
jgi:hypothetical protein